MLLSLLLIIIKQQFNRTYFCGKVAITVQEVQFKLMFWGNGFDVFNTASEMIFPYFKKSKTKLNKIKEFEYLSKKIGKLLPFYFTVSAPTVSPQLEKRVFKYSASFA